MPIRIRGGTTTENVTPARASGQQTASKTATTLPSFGDQLVLANERLIHRDMDKLYLDVEERGRRLLEQPTPEELARYKQSVRDFLAYVVKKGLKLKSTLSARELHQIVEKVDQELLDFADEFLAKERHVLDLGSKIDLINGMLLDLKA